MAQLAQAGKTDAEIVRLAADNHAKEIKIQVLTLELAHHKRLKISAKTEVFTAEQRGLFIECEQTDLSAIQAELAQFSSTPTKLKARPTARKALTAELPRIEHHHEPTPCNCAQCGKGLVKFREDNNKHVEVELARFFDHRHIRP